MKNRIRRLVSMVLVLALCFGLVQIGALAEENDTEIPKEILEEGFEPKTMEAMGIKVAFEKQVNPVYNDYASVALLPYAMPELISTYDLAEYATTIAAAGKQLRDGMKQRETEIKVYYESEDQYYAGMSHDISDAAMAHNGTPTEGDYIKWQYGGWKASISYSFSGGKYHYTITYTVSYYTTLAQEQAVSTKIASTLSSLKLDGKTNYQKVKAIYDYIVDNVSYDNVHSSTYKLKHTCYAALVDKLAVCQGYALLLYRMLLEVGIDTRIITGIGNGGGHAWNIIKLGGVYYNADSTWDAGGWDGRYFLRNEANFNDHLRESPFDSDSFYAAYPMSKTDYRVGSVEILYNPVNILVQEDEPAFFTVTASGTGLTYQWQYKVPGGSWNNCSSATTGYNAKTVEPVGAITRNGYQYRCLVTDTYGNTETSSAATLSVQPVLKITTQPADQTVTEGASAAFTVVASNAATYQWQYKTPNGAWTNCSSATAGYNTATVKPVGTATRNGYQYRCIVKNSEGKSVTSAAAKLTVSSSLKITSQPANQTVVEGASAAFKVAATGTGLTYQWYYSPNGTDWGKCSSATAGYNTATLKPVGTAARNGYQYRCVVKDASGKSVTSAVAKLTVTTGPKITAQPVNQTVAEGSSASFTVTATGTGLKYQWYYSSNGTDWGKCSSTTAGYNTATAKPVATTARNGYQYRCVITDANGKSVTSSAAKLTLTVSLKITSQPANQTVAEGASAAFTVKASGTGLTYQWQYLQPGYSWKDCSSATAGYNTATVKPVGTTARNGYQYRCVVKDASGKSVVSESAKLTVTASAAGPKITLQPMDMTVYEGDKAYFSVAATSDAPVGFQWQYSPDGVNWGKCTSATAGYNGDTLSPVGTAARNGYRYRCIVTDANGKSVTSAVAQLTVKS